MRMYICLQPLRSGFIKGYRPLIGIDGCHLKRAYPGLGKDGNNNIYPIARAIVEVENKDTWCWFLECLKKDLGDVCEGGGWTFMSDRQKDLLEAFELQVPTVEKRYCVRHIWASLKLQFSGSTFKELFWNATRATTLVDFEVAMESIKFLSEDAYVYLDNIPAKHWSRHAFSSDCKSNMLLNNVCETFNAVIRDARDKPILTQMEWIRRYMMKRHNEKWEAIKKMDGKLMSYVTKFFERIERDVRHCIVQVSRGDSYEVELNGKRTCTCYHGS
ncbi:uncharacterized protein LOC110692149 [Chenopodium quinoa]|uniref:uncharacterized protein LOC110692149 n=1 Tax=Chenopodium quinoa TaxID=63459 RepID=UPI000B771EA1|nr:uncharacterized protein LOC110692149 [Chenopodium quinoa]